MKGIFQKRFLAIGITSREVFLFSLFTICLVSFVSDKAYAVSYEAQSMNGEIVSLERYEGNVVMLNGWATWCKDCLKEMPALETLHKEFEDQGLVVIGTSTDVKGSDDKVSAFAKRLGVTYTILRDPDDRFTRTFKAVGLPHTVLLDRNGEIVYEWRGAFDPTSEHTKLQVKKALGEISVDTTEHYSLETIGIIAALSAGLLSFLSPCVLPLIPAYASFITGISLQDLSQKNSSDSFTKSKIRTKALTRGSLFVLGFSTIFILLGTTVAFVGSVFLDATTWIEKIGGIILIVLGIHLIGLLRIPWLERQIKFDISKRPSGKASSFVVGMAFGAGWTPCIGPILAGILAIAATSSSASIGALLLSVYSAGLAIPFVLSALAIDRFLAFFDMIKKRMMWIERISGGLLIGIGVLLLTGSLTVLSDIFSDTLTPEIALSTN